jgi:hypothetical protein
MEKPREDELTILKRKRIDRLKQDLRVALEKEKEKEESKNPRESDFGIEVAGFGTWSGPSVQIKERIQFLEDSVRRQPIPDNIVGVDGGITKEQFQQNITKYVFHTNQGGQEVIRCSGQIPSLDGIKLPILFRYGGLNDGGYVNEPKTQEEFNALKTSRSGHSRCNVELSRCGIRILGSVQFPPFAYTIHLSDNDITSLNGVKFGRCVEINLARNFISSLKGCRFSEGTTTLDLRDNNITKLTDLNVRELPRSLERIILDGNPLMDNPDGIVGYETAIYNEIMRFIRDPPPVSSAPNLSEIGGGSKQKSKTKRKTRRKVKKTNKRRNTKNTRRK